MPCTASIICQIRLSYDHICNREAEWLLLQPCCDWMLGYTCTKGLVVESPELLHHQLSLCSQNTFILIHTLWGLSVEWWLCNHFTHEPRAVTMKLWEPKKEVFKGRPDMLPKSCSVGSGHGLLSVVWGHIWPGPQPMLFQWVSIHAESSHMIK